MIIVEEFETASATLFFAAAMNASPIPVFPLVGSTSVVFPGAMRPFASASEIILYPILSFTLQHGSIISSLDLSTITARQNPFFLVQLLPMPWSSLLEVR
jgi:hypothetical protein